MHNNKNNQEQSKDLQQHKEEFINKLVDNLNDINTQRLRDKQEPLDVCFMTSVVDTNIIKYTNFINNLQYGYFIEDYEEDPTGYTNGHINIQIRKDKPITYTIEFQDNYIDYIDMHVPTFEISKVEYLGGEMWDIENEDLDEYRQEYIIKHQKIASEYEEQLKDKKKHDLATKIALLQNELNSLDL